MHLISPPWAVCFLLCKNKHWSSPLSPSLASNRHEDHPKALKIGPDLLFTSIYANFVNIRSWKVPVSQSVVLVLLSRPGYLFLLVLQTEQLVFICLLLTVIVSGNSLVLITQLSPRTRRSRMNFFIMHLALADLSVGLLSVSTDIVWKVTMTWEAGLLACKLIRFLQVVVTYASTYVLVALSIDRYDAITHPMAFTGSCKCWFQSHPPHFPSHCQLS